MPAVFAVQEFRLTLIFLQENASPEQHAMYVWKELISPCVKAQHIAVVTYGYGGVVVMHMVCQSIICPFALFTILLISLQGYVLLPFMYDRVTLL